MALSTSMVFSFILNDGKVLADLQSFSNEFQTVAPGMQNCFVRILLLIQGVSGLRYCKVFCSSLKICCQRDWEGTVILAYLLLCKPCWQVLQESASMVRRTEDSKIL